MYIKKFQDLVMRAMGNYSQRQVAVKMNVSPSSIANMAMGRIPSDEILRKFCVAMEIDCEDTMRKVRLWKEETHLKQFDFLTDADREEIVSLMERKEEEYKKKNKQ